MDNRNGWIKTGSQAKAGISTKHTPEIGFTQKLSTHFRIKKNNRKMNRNKAPPRQPKPGFTTKPINPF
jgi:hypothetical protein